MTAEIRKVNAGDAILSPFWCDSIAQSQDIWVGLWEGEVALIWGIAPLSLLSDQAYIWSVSTPVIKRCAKTLLRLSRAWLKEILIEYPTLIGLCDCKTVWLEHLGAKLSETPGEYAIFEIRK